ncbi:MAG: glycosyltransferase family 2 protein, partial [Janthinobacterium lividum]
CPVYREEAAIAAFHHRLAAVIDSLSTHCTARIIYVVDPSTDGTERVLAEIAAVDPRVEVLVMSRRFGHQMALVAGIDHADGDAVIMLDSDLQHPPELIPTLVQHWEDGADIVQTIRQDGAEIGWLKRSTSRWFYSTFMRVGAVELRSGAADYRLLSRRVATIFRDDMREHNQFLRGLVSWMGFRTVYVPFVPQKREQGVSKYRPSTLINFALNGICSFSKLPLRFCIGIGFTFALLSIVGGSIQVLLYFFSSAAVVPGWATLVAIVTFATGVQLFFLGVIGEYISLIFDEVKGRPLYLLAQRFGAGAEDDRTTPAVVGRSRRQSNTDMVYERPSVSRA